jgi:hypothetical protein
MSLYLRNSSRLTEELRDHTATLRNVTLPAKSETSISQALIEIVSYTLISGEANRWEYTVRLASLEKASMDFSTNDSLDLFKAYNGWEAANDASSVLVLNGDDPDDLPAGFTVDPLPAGLVTLGTAQYFSDADASTFGGFAYFFLSEPNPISGVCS